MEKFDISLEGKLKLEERLKELNEVIIPQAVERLKTAREFGDLSENAEYVAAKENLARLTAEKEEIEAKLRLAVIYTKKATDKIELGVEAVIALQAEGGKSFERKYSIVGTAEANIAENKDSTESELGKAILGRKVGETVTYIAPTGKKMTVEIKEIIS